MTRIIPILLALVICLCPQRVFAAGGRIEVSLPPGMAGEKVTYAKEGEKKQTVTVNSEGIAIIENLKEGVYEIDVPETSEYSFTSASVSIPMWSEEEERMLYDISVIPKYIQKEVPLTGDKVASGWFGMVGIISFIIVVIISCHNYFKCGRMTVKYSKDGGHNNGNDNDTENPRSSCGIGIGSSGTID